MQKRRNVVPVGSSDEKEEKSQVFHMTFCSRVISFGALHNCKQPNRTIVQFIGALTSH
jgi:hypothetical protein